MYIPSVSYSSVCNVLRLWSISLIPTYRVYRFYDYANLSPQLCVMSPQLCVTSSLLPPHCHLTPSDLPWGPAPATGPATDALLASAAHAQHSPSLTPPLWPPSESSVLHLRSNCSVAVVYCTSTVLYFTLL